jgi:hypothetical protein
LYFSTYFNYLFKRKARLIDRSGLEFRMRPNLSLKYIKFKNENVK